MQIEEVQQKKLDLAKMIRDQVIEFEKETGCKIASVYLQRHIGLAGRDFVSVELEVSL